MSEHHICNSETCPAPGNYYVTAIDGDRFWKMAGPYATHELALSLVNIARDIANEKDRSGRAWFMGWGTARMKTNEPGNLNKAGLM